jgi:hypothetical protein
VAKAATSPSASFWKAALKDTEFASKLGIFTVFFEIFPQISNAERGFLVPAWNLNLSMAFRCYSAIVELVRSP